MRVHLAVTESKGGGTATEVVISERVLETESHKRLTAKRAAQILAREFPELGLLSKVVIKTDRGWVTSKSTEPLRKCGYHYVWRHYYVRAADGQ